jgi:hypothetical protein
MKAVLQISLKTTSSEEGQRILIDLCEKMKQRMIIDGYRFEIETVEGTVTDRCVLADEKVIA